MKEKSFIAAVSGGPDSMCMLDIYRDRIKAVCFVNYHDRDDTHIDQKIVKEYCKKYNVKLHILDVTEEIYSKYPYNNYQDQCRRIRYNFFNQIAKIYGLIDVIVAHNYNDFLETAYSQILSNKKNMFLGIKKISYYKNIRIIRPLINFPKALLQKYCDANSIQYMIDSTNSKDIYQRNIHGKLLWILDENTFRKLGNYINSYNELNAPYDLEINKYYLLWKSKNFDLSYILEKAYFYQYHMVYKYLSNNFISRINRNKINQIIDFIFSKKQNTYYRLSNNIFLTKKYNELKMVRG